MFVSLESSAFGFHNYSQKHFGRICEPNFCNFQQFQFDCCQIDNGEFNRFALHPNPFWKYNIYTKPQFGTKISIQLVNRLW